MTALIVPVASTISRMSPRLALVVKYCGLSCPLNLKATKTETTTMIPTATNQGRLSTFSSFLKTEAGFLSDFTINKTDGNHGYYWGLDLRQQNYYGVIVAAADERQPVCDGQLTTHSN